MTVRGQAEFEDDLYRRNAEGESLRSLAEEAGLGRDAVRKLIERAAGRDPIVHGDNGHRPRRQRRKPEILETWEQRDARFAAQGHDVRALWTDALRTASKPRVPRDKRTVRASARVVGGCFATAGPTRCAAGLDASTSTARENGDPTAGWMMFVPPPCAGCGDPLWDRPTDAKYHRGHACSKRASRKRLGKGPSAGRRPA